MRYLSNLFVIYIYGVQSKTNGNDGQAVPYRVLSFLKISKICKNVQIYKLKKITKEPILEKMERVARRSFLKFQNCNIF